MNDDGRMRRAFLTGSAAFALAAMACSKKALECAGDMDLPASARNARKSAEYLEHATDPKRACRRCRYWQDEGKDQCGGCTLLRGAIHPDGTCRLFAVNE